MLLSLSLMILVGLIMASLFIKLKLPHVIGMLVAGIILGPYVLNLLAPEVLTISIDLRKIALIIILLRAGLSLHLDDLKVVGKQAFFLSFIPASFEILATIVLAPLLLGITILEAAILGSILAAVSPAIIVPKMLKMIKENHGTKRSIPQLVMASASVDDVFVIVVFTSLLQVAQGEGNALGSIVNLPLSILFGIGLGIILGLFFIWFFKRFHLRDSLKVMILIAIGMLSIVLEQANILPFSGLLATMTMGITLLMKYPVLAKRLVKKYEKVWVFSETMLFVLVGAAVNILTIPSIGWQSVLLIFGILLVRMLGVLVASQSKNISHKERIFLMITFIPKATVQASIGSIPFALGLPQGELMITVSVLAILISAPLGAFLIDKFKQKLIPVDG